jgi:hypothetical protein
MRGFICGPITHFRADLTVPVPALRPMLDWEILTSLSQLSTPQPREPAPRPDKKRGSKFPRLTAGLYTESDKRKKQGEPSRPENTFRSQVREERQHVVRTDQREQKACLLFLKESPCKWHNAGNCRFNHSKEGTTPGQVGGRPEGDHHPSRCRCVLVALQLSLWGGSCGDVWTAPTEVGSLRRGT